MRRFTTSTLLLLITLSLPAELTQIRSDSSMSQGLELYAKAVSGDKKAVERAIKLFDSMLKGAPKNGRIMALLGSCYTLRARGKKAPWSKLKWTRKGLGLLDGAVELAPEDLRIRFYRLMTAVRLPGAFKRSETAEKDLSRLLKGIDAPLFSKRERQQVYLNGGNFRLKQKEMAAATALWKKCAEINRDNDLGKKARRKLLIYKKKGQAKVPVPFS